MPVVDERAAKMGEYSLYREGGDDLQSRLDDSVAMTVMYASIAHLIVHWWARNWCD